MHFATNVLYLRRKHNWSQTDLGDKVGVDYAAIGRYERGNSTPNLAVITRLAQVFGVGIDDLRNVDLRNPAPEKLEEVQVNYAAQKTGVTPGVQANSIKPKVLVTFELDGTPECFERAAAQLAAMNEVVARIS